MRIASSALATAASIAFCAAAQTLPLGKPIPGMTPAEPKELTLQNPDFEAPMREGASCPTGWGCIMHAASDSFRFFYDEAHPAAGKRSGCLESVGREPWGKLVQAHRVGDSVRGKHVRVSALLKLEDVTGNGAGLILRADGGSGNELAYRFEPKAGSAGWHPVSAELDIPPGTYVLELGLALKGKGRACLDEVRFEVR
jgi:hypothetical protein